MLLIHLPNVEAELARLLLRSTLEMESEAEDLIESLLSSISDEVELDPSELFLFTVVWNEFLILSNKDRFSSSGSISMTSFGGKLCRFSTEYGIEDQGTTIGMISLPSFNSSISEVLPKSLEQRLFITNLYSPNLVV